MPEPQPSLAQHYHDRTKYSRETLAQKAQSIDWSKQPIPYKEYKLGTSFDLKPYLVKREDAEPPADEAEKMWRRLAHLFFLSYGLTTKMQTMSGDPVYLRAAPSAGALYPAEVYLISRGTPLLPAGLYNYQPKTHSLLLFWESDVWAALQNACFWHPTLDHTQLALVTTAVFYRSAWRYRDRAYRRICLDTGHLLGNIELAAAIYDFRPHLIGGFADAAVNELLYLDTQQEGTLTVMALADLLDVRQNLPLAPTAIASPIHSSYPAIPDDELLPYFHHATAIATDSNPSQSSKPLVSASATQADSPTAPLNETIQDKYNFPFCLKVSTKTQPVYWGESLLGLEKTIGQRRSTRAYTGANITIEELKAVLDFTYNPHHYYEQTLDRHPDYFDLGLIETFIAVSGVDGLEEGCYYYAPKAEELRQIRFKNFRHELHELCLEQNLGRDAAVVLFHTADLQKAVETYGDRAYRYLHLDAGHLGQRLNLAAIHLGLGVSGIAGFFDDEVNEVLGIPTDEAALYITTLGRPR
ncbi:MAG: SagB/ThcOx family dehydrogenase [Synechococcales cyanobacterium T60_A2020_003]|nr:SagB/ThcOx family dehydrogenase [Synechococcales cyanobacterium T60_A2020_003]